MLTPQQVKKFSDELNTAKNPLFLFDDDPDGLCSFLLLYRMNREGHGTVVKTIPVISTFFLRKVQEYHPDKIFILDMPIVEQDFIDQAKRPIFWLDHHPPLELININYFNPRIKDPSLYIPTTRMAYQISKNPADLWIAMVGCLGDYHLPTFKDEFIKQYPDLLTKDADLDQAIFDQPVGLLTRVFSFLLKGKTSDVNKCIKILTRLKSPYEILRQESSPGKFLYKKFEDINQKYELLLAKAKKTKPQGDLLIFIYDEQSWSFTSELSSELAHRHPDKIIIVGRKKSGEMKCSLRSRKLALPQILEKSLLGLDGRGGGHERACGLGVNEEDWDQFLKNFKKEIKQAVTEHA